MQSLKLIRKALFNYIVWLGEVYLYVRIFSILGVNCLYAFDWSKLQMSVLDWSMLGASSPYMAEGCTLFYIKGN